MSRYSVLKLYTYAGLVVGNSVTGLHIIKPGLNYTKDQLKYEKDRGRDPKPSIAGSVGYGVLAGFSWPVYLTLAPTGYIYT